MPPVPDARTLAVYSSAARAYAKDGTLPADVDQDADVAAFLSLVPKGAHVLDLGCGPGQWAARLVAEGLVVDAIDPCPEMVALATARFGIAAREATLADLPKTAAYDGVWANFSLLHVPRSALPDHLSHIRALLRPKGALHIAMKLGAGESRDAFDRFFTYYREEDLAAHLEAAGFTISHIRRGNRHDRSGDPDTFVVMTAHA